MAQRSTQIMLAGDEWLNLGDLVQGTVSANNEPAWPLIGQRLDIISSKDNDGASRLQITSNPNNVGIPYQLLPEEHKEFFSSIRSNNISIQDKWLKIVDDAGVAIVGTAEIVLDSA